MENNIFAFHTVTTTGIIICIRKNIYSPFNGKNIFHLFWHLYVVTKIGEKIKKRKEMLFRQISMM